MRNATSKHRLIFRGGIVVVVVGRLGEYDGVLGGAGERLSSGDVERLVLAVELLLLLKAMLGSTRTDCCMLTSIVILMGRRSTAK
jgi:hypothetical protein